MVLLSILVSGAVIIVASWYIIYYKYNRYLKKYPGPTPLPLIGNALHFSSVEELLTKSMHLHEVYGPVIKMYVGFFPPALQICDPKLLEAVLGSTKVLDKGTDYIQMHPWLGTGLLTSGAAKWKKHRKILTPAFHFQILERFIDTFNLHSEILINKMKRDVGKDSTDIYPYITLCSLDIICASSMGTAVNAQKDENNEYVKSVKSVSRIIMEKSLSLLYAFDFIYFLTPNYRAERKGIKVIHDYTNSVISSRKLELQKSKESTTSNEKDVEQKERKSFLDLLLQHKMDKGDITDEEIREEVNTFMFEGHDTTSSAISFTLYCLATNPDIQKQAVEELRSIFHDDKDRFLTIRDLHEMKYLEMVIKESLRLYPSVPLMSRDVVEDIEIDGGIIPKHVTLIIFPYGVHRDPKIYPDPEKFDPERFTPEEQTKRSPYAYIPFSAGPRNCIGQKFAMLEMKAVVSRILREFELLPAIPEHKPLLVSEIILKSKTGVRLRLEKRRF